MNAFELRKQMCQQLSAALLRERYDANWKPDYLQLATQCLQLYLEGQDLPELVEQAWQQLAPMLDSQNSPKQPEHTLEALCYQVADAKTPRENSRLLSLYFLHEQELEQIFENLDEYMVAPESVLVAAVRAYLEQALISRLEQAPCLP